MPPDYYVSITPRPPAATESRLISTERLVRAKNQARALAHVVADTIVIEPAGIDTVVRLTKAGVEIEEAA